MDKGCHCSTSNHVWFEFKKKNRKKIDHMKLNRCSAYIAILKAPQTVQKLKNPTKAQRDLNPGSREEKNETLLQEQDYQLIASVTKTNQHPI